MALRFTESHAQSLVLPLLFPGEQILHRARGIEKPWWSWFVGGALAWKYYFVVATNQRIIFIQHKGIFGGYGTKAVETASWQQVSDVKLGWGIFNKSLTIRAPQVGIDRTVDTNRFAFPGNFEGGQGIVQTFSSMRQLPYGQAPAGQMLPA